MLAIGRREFLVGAAGLACGARGWAVQDPPRDLAHTLSVVEGNPRERGRAYGAQVKDAMRAFLEREIYASFDGRPNTRETMLRFAAACGKAVKAFSPVVLEEMEGIAEASGLRLEEVVLINNHEELWHRGVIKAVDHCTVFGASPPDTAGDTTFVAQTWDWMETVYGLSSMVHWKRTEGPSVLGYAYPGLWTGAGINARGLALCWHSGGGDGKEPRVGIPAYALISQILYQETLDAALEEVRRATHAGWFVYLLATPRAILQPCEGPRRSWRSRATRRPTGDGSGPRAGRRSTWRGCRLSAARSR